MFETETIRFDGYIQILCKGPATLDNLKSVVDKIKNGELGALEPPQYLIDLRPITGTLGTFERYELGIYIAESIPKIRIAAISKKETYSKIGENVAVNRGANILATDDEQAAKTWLLLS
jgi:hypothetical protein